MIELLRRARLTRCHSAFLVFQRSSTSLWCQCGVEPRSLRTRTHFSQSTCFTQVGVQPASAHGQADNETVLWFAAFIAVAMWNSEGIKEGAKEKKISDDDRNCTTFKYGSEAMCNISKGSVGIGVMIL